MPSEHALVPYQAAGSVAASSVLVLAPHPDDEVFGCGGAIAQHLESGCAVHVVVLTDGGVGGDAATRAEECRQAAGVLGLGPPEFWNLPDRGLVASADLVLRLAACIGSRGADLVYAPSPYEVHPDHRQTTALMCAAAARLERPVRVAFYEVGSPLPQPNLLLDITPWHERKRAAARCFGSQLAAQDYAEQIEGLGRYRTYTLPRAVRAAEAFCIVDSTELARGAGFELALAPADTWERMHDPAAAAGAPARPRVTVVMRSMGRPLLHEALDSVARQTWPDVEVLVVAAVAGHPALPPRCGPHPLRLVGTGLPLARSRAANVGLAHATGEYLLLLDDDDWLLPSHLARLVGALHGQKLWRAAYTGIVLVDAANRPIGQTFDWPFDPMRQRAGNLTPIHAVLFHRSLLDEGCRFDEALDRDEDWDFWLQVAARTAMAHVPGASAAYRIHASSGMLDDAGAASASSLAIHEKWEASWSGRQKREIMTRVWACDEQATELADRSQALLAQGEALRAEVQTMRQSRDALSIELHAMHQSRSWRWTAPLRRAGRLLGALRRALRQV